MSETIAKKYAQALFEIGQEKDISDQLAEELRIVKQIFNDHSELYTFLKHPRLKEEQKSKFVDESFHQLHPNIIHVLHLLIERGRVEIIPSFVDQFIQMVNDAKGIAVATVYSVRELSDDEKQTLSQNFAKRLNKKSVQVHNVIDPSILGGLRIQVGHTIYDGTIRGKLDQLEQNIMAANK